MDTLFKLVSLQSSDQSFNNSTSRTSSSSRSSRQNYPYHHHHQEEDNNQECFNFYMDEDDFSSSSSRQPPHTYHHPYQPPPPPHHHQISHTTTPTNTTSSTSATTPSQYHHQVSYDHHHHHHHSLSAENNQFSFSPSHDINQEFSPSYSGKWASDILLEAARAVADKNSARLQQLMWMLNELSSPYGDTDQKLASYFLQALFSRMTDSGDRCYRTLISSSDKTCSFESTRKMVLKFQEVSPWTTFGHVACNGAIIEALDGESKLHILDFSNTFCTQWPTLLEALATRTDETPHLRLTTVVVSGKGGGGSGGATRGVAGVQRVMKEIGSRMEKFARLMGVPFKFDIIHHGGDLSELNLSELNINEDEALAINCVNSLHSVPTVNNRREVLISLFRRLQPRIVTVVEEEADLDFGVEGFEFVKGFQECLRWFRVYFESLDESFSRTSHERLMLERQAGHAIMDLVACQPAESIERRETASRWSSRLHAGGFRHVPLSDEVCDDVRALLRRYREGWTMSQCSEAGVFLSWKDQPLVWASAWRP